MNIENKLKCDLTKYISEDKITDYRYNGENFYFLGRGHSFLRGFFGHYVTKSGIEGKNFDSFWAINGKRYEYINSKFLEVIINEKYKSPNFDDVALPKIRRSFKL